MAQQLSEALARKRESEAARTYALLLDAKNAAAFLGVSLRTLYALRASGDLPPPVQLGERIVRYRRADLVAFTERLQAPTVIPEPAQLARGKRRARAEAVAA